ncbi:hypothetical protein AB1Y20_003630 [Prymnesium parvum]|uniref:Transcription initiation factor IIF subunit alpha n=1 Tax=Prymnesium parvum TaxID=97485 RepID=A0AB34J7F4_PRYPA
MSKPPRGPRQLRVKLTGAGNYTRHLQDASTSETRATSPSLSEASPAPFRAGVGACAASSASSAGKPPTFQPGDKAVMEHGGIVYEVEILHKARHALEPSKKLPPAARRAKPAAALASGYQFRYLKWPRRGDEWAAEAHFQPWTPWSASLAKACTSRPPRKNMWSDGKPLGDGGAADEEHGEKMDGDTGSGSGEGDEGKDFRRAGKGARATSVSSEEVGRKRERKPSEKLREEPASRAKTPNSEGGQGEGAENAHADVLMGMLSGGKPKKREAEQEDEDDNGEEEEESESEDEGEEEHEEEEMEKGDDEELNEFDEEDEGYELGMVLARQARKQQRMAADEQEESQDSDRAVASSTHKRKGLPVKSLPASKQTPLWLSHEGQMKMFQEQVRAQTKVFDPSNVIAPVNSGSHSAKGPCGARRRKSSCPVRSL